MVTKNQYLLIFIGFLSLIIIFLTPYGFHIDLGPGPNSLMAILWEYRDLEVFSWFTVLEYFPYYIFRFITLYYIIKYITSVVSKKKAIMMAIVSELIPLLLSIPGALFLNSDGENYIPITISIPILLIYNLIVIFTFSKINLNNKELK